MNQTNKNQTNISITLATFMILVSGILSAQTITSGMTINSSGTWSAASGLGSITFAAGQCYTVTVQAWGGGGGGGFGSGGGGGGGTGGGFAQGVVNLSSGTYYFNIGASGAAGTSAVGGNGGVTWFNGTAGSNNNTSGSFVNAGGGTGGNSGASSDAGVQTAVGTGTFGTG
ncbi:MAG TPA: hypothetical protein VGB95_07560, partial [Chitinophagales bacterium]